MLCLKNQSDLTKLLIKIKGNMNEYNQQFFKERNNYDEDTNDDVMERFNRYKRAKAIFEALSKKFVVPRQEPNNNANDNANHNVNNDG